MSQHTDRTGYAVRETDSRGTGVSAPVNGRRHAVAGSGGATGVAEASKARRPRQAGVAGRHGLLRALVGTGDRPIDLFLRVMLALVMFPHGAQKLLGWFGGPGFGTVMHHLTGDYGLPTLVALLVVGIEFFGPIALVLGLFSRAAASGIAAVMIGAAVMVHVPYGFFMDWFGVQGGEGFEYHLLAIGLSVSVLVNGSGPFSLDRLLLEEVAG